MDIAYHGLKKAVEFSLTNRNLKTRPAEFLKTATKLRQPAAE
jgi:hypothetical protein